MQRVVLPAMDIPSDLHCGSFMDQARSSGDLPKGLAMLSHDAAIERMRAGVDGTVAGGPKTGPHWH